MEGEEYDNPLFTIRHFMKKRENLLTVEKKKNDEQIKKKKEISKVPWVGHSFLWALNGRGEGQELKFYAVRYTLCSIKCQEYNTNFKSVSYIQCNVLRRTKHYCSELNIIST